MIATRTLDKTQIYADKRHAQQALRLAAAMPPLVSVRRSAAATMNYGLHGRRRAGVGENFWQFRAFIDGESASKIDWRRSARDDRLFVREREWETSKDFWLWIDQSTSMHFISSLALDSKLDRAYTLGLALSHLLVSNGERVGLIGLTPPRAKRTIIDYFVEVLALRAGAADQTIPVTEPLPARTQAILIGDFLDPPHITQEKIAHLAIYGASGHLLAIIDPLEETFPFIGHTEFVDSDSPARLSVGEAHSWRVPYQNALREHRQKLKAITEKFHWSFSLHHTDKPASEALLGLIRRLEASGSP